MALTDHERATDNQMHNGTAVQVAQASRSFSPRLLFLHQSTKTFLAESLGERWASIEYHLPRPPLEACVRVNTLKATRGEVMERLREELRERYEIVEGPLESSIIIKGSRREQPIVYDDTVLKGREIVVGMLAGQAMLKGAELYVPGILALTKNLVPGDLVAVSIGVPVDPEKKLYGITRQSQLQPYVPLDDERFPGRRELFIGVGEVLLERRDISNPTAGMAMVMREKLYDLPSLPNDFMDGLIMNQAFPSLLAACVLAPTPGSTVLDMCASPGGKTTAMAQLMENRGKIYAVDRGNKKVRKIEEFANTMGIDIIVPIKGDACELVNEDKKAGDEIIVGQKHVEKSARSLVADERKRLMRIRHGHEPRDSRVSANVASGGFAPESFEYILLDAACSALGVRPRFVVEASLDELLKSAMYSRRMLEQAARLLKPGGTLVFSTCTISPLENEANVRFILDRCPDMKLVGAGPGLHHGGPGLTGEVTVTEGKAPFKLLTAEEAALVQRFDPSDDTYGRSTMGFFIAKFERASDS